MCLPVSPVARCCLYVLGGLLPLAPLAAGAQALAGSPSPPGPVVVAGVVPDEATRQAIVGRLKELYGADRVVDELGVDALVAPPQWAQHVQRMLGPELRQVSRGELAVQGNVVQLKGDVPNEALRQQVVSQLSTRIANPTYTVRNGLRVAVAGQDQLDAALANRIVEFEPASAVLTPQGKAVLDQLWPVLQRMPGRQFEIVGHTDAQGARSANVALSQARADAVRAYLVNRGLPTDAFVTAGVGPDRPVAPNDSAEGRARNRRIEFRVLQ